VNNQNDRPVIYPGKKFVAKTGINRFNIVKIEAISPDSSPDAARDLLPPLPVPEFHSPDFASDGLGQDLGELDLARVLIRPE